MRSFLLLVVMMLLFCLASESAYAQCENGQCQVGTPYSIRVPAPATTYYGSPTRPVIRSTYAPSAPRWRPVRRAFAGFGFRGTCGCR